MPLFQIFLRGLDLVIVHSGNDVLNDRARRNTIRLAGFDCDRIVSYWVDNYAQTSALNGTNASFATDSIDDALRNIQLVRFQDYDALCILNNESACKPRGYGGYAPTRRQ